MTRQSLATYALAIAYDVWNAATEPLRKWLAREDDVYGNALNRPGVDDQ